MAAKQLAIPSAKYIFAVASGKGGVGKSTVAANMALALAHHERLTVGLMDADVFGPSQHHMLNVLKRPVLTEQKRIKPIKVHGIEMISMGCMMKADDAAVWRGPMVMSAIHTFCHKVDWSAEVIVIDMPPGTGDVQLSITQQLALKGALIVSTPQDIALIDARRGIAMFRKVNVPILGIIENQSYFACPKCGHASHIYGHGGAVKVAEELDVQLLGQIPLDISIREAGDAGCPVVLKEPDSPQAVAFREVAQKIHQQINSTLQQQTSLNNSSSGLT